MDYRQKIYATYVSQKTQAAGYRYNRVDYDAWSKAARARLNGLILQTPNAESPLVGAVAYGDFTHEWFFTPASLADLLRLTGLTQYEARPSGPYAHGLKSALRHILWSGFKVGLALWNLTEVGHRGSGIYTRVFVATAVKPQGKTSGGSTS